MLARFPGRATAAAGSQSYAGHWVLQYFVHCNAAKLSDCDTDWTDVPGATAQVMTVRLLSDAQGHFTFQYDRTITGKVAGVSPQCNAQMFAGAVQLDDPCARQTVSPQCNAKLFDGPSMTGVCRMTAHGKGVFTTRESLVPQFFVSDEWITFYGKAVVREVHNPPDRVKGGSEYKASYPEAWFIPAVPGYYDTKSWAEIGGAPVNMVGNGVTTIQELVVRY
jgi:hypothetical protein